MNYENKEFFINCDGINIHSKLDFPADAKDKMPIMVLIPGFTGHIEEPHIIAFAEAANAVGFVTLRSEMYGHGQSEGDFYKHNVLLWMSEASRVITYASELPFVSDVYLAGHSQGGLTAVLAAGVMKDKIKALLPISPAMSIFENADKGDFLGVKFDNDNLPKEISCPEWTISSDYIRAARMLPVRQAVASFKKPVCIIHGTEDEAIPYEFAVDLADEYENARLVPVEGDTHCFDHHLDKAVEAIREFLLSQIG